MPKFRFTGAYASYVTLPADSQVELGEVEPGALVDLDVEDPGPAWDLVPDEAPTVTAAADAAPASKAKTSSKAVAAAQAAVAQAQAAEAQAEAALHAAETPTPAASDAEATPATTA